MGGDGIEILQVGNEITGTVSRIVGFGAFIKLEDGFELLLPTSEMSGARDELDPNPRNLVAENAEITGTVIKVDGNKVAMTNMSEDERKDTGPIEGEKVEATVMLGGSLLNDLSALNNTALQAMLAAAPSESEAAATPAEEGACPLWRRSLTDLPYALLASSPVYCRKDLLENWMSIAL